jgi:hypothetical protein
MWYIYVMDVIYMSFVVFAVIEIKNKKNKNFLSTLVKEPFPSAFCPSTRQSCQKMHYQVSLPSASALTLGKAVYTTMCFTALPSARAMTLGKEFPKKLCRVLPQTGTRQRIF